jgi:hypothetical protein
MTIRRITRPQGKPTRNTSRRPGRFGAGLLRSMPNERTGYSQSDRDWWARASAALEARLLDRRACEAEAESRLEMDCCL